MEAGMTSRRGRGHELTRKKGFIMDTPASSTCHAYFFKLCVDDDNLDEAQLAIAQEWEDPHTIIQQS